GALGPPPLPREENEGALPHPGRPGRGHGHRGRVRGLDDAGGRGGGRVPARLPERARGPGRGLPGRGGTEEPHRAAAARARGPPAPLHLGLAARREGPRALLRAAAPGSRGRGTPPVARKTEGGRRTTIVLFEPPRPGPPWTRSATSPSSPTS